MMDYFLADDLSGALDAAAAFCRVGRRVIVVLRGDPWELAREKRGPEGAVLGITTETRNLPSETAATIVGSVVASGRARGARLLYKKIDSTLRGPVAAELGALASMLPAARFLFCPANPRAGRTVQNGVLRVHGVPVAETEFGRDPTCPARESSIAALLGSIPAMARVVIADAQNDTDLDAAVERIDAMGEPWVAIGSGALAGPVAVRLFKSERKMLFAAERASAGPILFICGSAHPGNRQQASRLTEARGVPQHIVTANTIERGVEAAIASVNREGQAALLLGSERTDSAAALLAITSAAHRVIEATNATRIFATGGETAFALCRQLGIDALTFEDEIEPGLSVSTAQVRRQTLQWAIKPGGFGDAQTWIRGFDRLRVAD